jgi:hypothetical protein
MRAKVEQLPKPRAFRKLAGMVTYAGRLVKVISLNVEWGRAGLVKGRSSALTHFRKE